MLHWETGEHSTRVIVVKVVAKESGKGLRVLVD
jgi:hypothetical protein